VLLARDWIPIPQHAIARNTDGSVLSWAADFNSEVVQRALASDSAPILVHSHGVARPAFSDDDRRKERALFGAVSQLVNPWLTGTLLLGQGSAAGSFWLAGSNARLRFRGLVVVGDVAESWPSSERDVLERPLRERLDRQTLAIGPANDRKLAEAVVAVVGVSGGGSHVVQQLTHLGVGGLVPVDDQTVELSNLGRMVGATLADVDRTLKTAVARRVAEGVEPSVVVTEVNSRFPSSESIAALKSADVIVACVDTFAAREAINAFARRYLIPLVDIGMALQSAGEQLAWASGQVIVSVPARPCLRCWFVTDRELEGERLERPPGYDQNTNAAGDPQVVSMNGVLASEACNCVLDLLTGYSGGCRGAKMWQYDGQRGELTPAELPSRRAGCPACAEEGRGDPASALGVRLVA
jgi:molybdopterin/thiamine biosynthesis adenylyltransferase